LYRTIQRLAQARDPGAIVTTPLVPGGTDLPWYRQLGIVAYGVDPFRIERTEVQRGLHGNDERIGTGVLADGVRFMYELVKAMQ
jgi:acetylornithine deacetylase/succinyl-diaminopimelate desuccinylase-like protein